MGKYSNPSAVVTKIYSIRLNVIKLFWVRNLRDVISSNFKWLLWSNRVVANYLYLIHSFDVHNYNLYHIFHKLPCFLRIRRLRSRSIEQYIIHCDALPFASFHGWRFARWYVNAHHSRSILLNSKPIIYNFHGPRSYHYSN